MTKKIRDLSLSAVFNHLVITSVTFFALIILVSVFVLSHETRKDREATLEDINRQIQIHNNAMLEKAINVANYVSFSNVTMNYLLCEDEYELISSKQQLDTLAHSQLDTDEQLINIIIYRRTHRIPYSANSLIGYTEFYSLTSTEENEETAHSDFGVLGQQMENGQTVYYPFYSAKIINTRTGSRYGEFLGTIFIVLNPDYLNAIIRSTASKLISAALVIDSQSGQILARSREASSITEEDVRNNPRAYWQPIVNTSWSIVCLFKEHMLFRRYAPFFISLFAFAAVIVGLLILLYQMIHIFFTRPLAQLLTDIDTVAGNEKYRIAERNIHDIDRIARHINSLLDQREQEAEKRIRLEKQQYEIEVNKKITDLYLLENQISPHFLLNTLTCIGGIAMSHHIPQITKLVSCMAGICHYSLRKSDTVTLREELDNVRQFFTIMDIRSPEHYRLSIHVPEALMGCQVPKMTLQPLVENAIYHGLEKQGGGEINIGVQSDHSVLRIRVEDDGIGIPPERLSELQAAFRNAAELEYLSILKKRVGNVNLCRRIKLIYGEPYGLQIESTVNRGTTVEVILPEQF